MSGGSGNTGCCCYFDYLKFYISGVTGECQLSRPRKMAASASQIQLSDQLFLNLRWKLVAGASIRFGSARLGR
jgi:hypothetical protein